MPLKIIEKLLPDRFKPRNPSVRVTNATNDESDLAKTRVNRVEKALEEFDRLDNEAKEFYRDFEPPIEIEKIGSKTFVRLGDAEFIAEYCSDISVKSTGKEPDCTTYYDSSRESIYTNCATHAIIEAHMVSGRTIEFWVNRHALEATYAALQKAHREAIVQSQD